jgi:hypothetical protein
MLRRYLALTIRWSVIVRPAFAAFWRWTSFANTTNGIVSRGTLPPLKPPLWRFRSGSRLRIFNFTRRKSHNMDGVADHVGRAALAFGISGNYAFFPVAAPCFWMKTFIFSRSEVAADAGLNPKHAFRKSKS